MPFYSISLEQFRNRLSHLEALPQYTLLGIISGVVTGLIILVFRQAIEIPLRWWLPEGDPENFEALSSQIRFISALGGATLIGILYSVISKDAQQVGVIRVLDRLNFHEGHFRLRNAITQFVVGVITLVSGQSAGREGTAIHLGAACNSYLGRRFKLPNNSIRILAGCGTAAAISASFNTPIAGVIFAMEVVMMEYTLAGFTPVIVAAVSAAFISQIVYGAQSAFSVPAIGIETLMDIPFTIALGLIIGTVAAAFISLVKWLTRFNHHHVFPRSVVAGIVTGMLAIPIPSIMGIGYDSVNLALTGTASFGLLAALAVGKFVATAVPVGLGLPYSLIGPVMVIGASTGATLGYLAIWLAPEHSSELALYAMLGMGAMMGAVLQAPLAALMALLELTGNHHIILPGMLAIVMAHLTARVIFKQDSIFATLLAAQGVELKDKPVLQALNRMGVASLMNEKFQIHDRLTCMEEAHKLLQTQPEWIILTTEGDPVALLPAVDLARHLESIEANNKTTAEKAQIDLLSIPARRRDLKNIPWEATIQEALTTLQVSGAEALYVERVRAPMIKSVVGVITRDDIENYYLYK